MKTTHISLTMLALLGLAACGKTDKPAANTPDTMAPAPAAQGAQATPASDAAALGKIKYGGICAGCHGREGQGQGNFPKLAGQSAEQIAGKLRDYKAGKTLGAQTAIMAPNAANLSDADIDALAQYIAAFPK
jgi:cytochrome c553